MEASIFEARYQDRKVAITKPGIVKPLTPVKEIEFERLFKEHFKSLLAYACTILKDEAVAEEIVQNVFFKIWDKDLQSTIQTSVKAYLYKAVYHDSLNYIKHQKIKAQYKAYAMQHNTQHTEQASKKLVLKELEEKIRQALNDLPQQCRTIFQLSRFEGLKYQEIAQQLNLSVKTVENQMGKALKLLRTKLVDYLPMLIVFIVQLLNRHF